MKNFLTANWLKKLFGVLVVAACASVFFWYGATPNITLLSKTELSDSPDYFLENVESKEFSTVGSLERTINATKLSHYNNQKQTIAATPRMESVTNGIAWTAIADLAQLNDANKDVLLTSNAFIIRSTTDTHANQLSADSIYYNDLDKSLISKGEATLTTIQGVTKADTIRSFIDLETAQLKGNVSGYYEQATSNQ